MNAEVLPFLAGSTPVKGAPPVARAVKPAPRKRNGIDALTTPPTHSEALANAAQNAAHNEELLAQLREIVNGPHARMSEARYEEFLSILGEQQSITEQQFATVDQALTNANTQSKAQFDNLVQRMTTSNNRIDVEVHGLRQSHAEELTKLREEHQVALQSLGATMDQRLRDLETAMRNSLAELTNSFTTFVAENNKVRDNDRMSMFAALENNIVQTRSEITDDYTRGFANVGGAIMEIGRKMAGVKAE